MNTPGKRERVAAWYRGKTGLIAFTLCIAIILVFVGIYLNNQASSKNNLESFNCHSSSNETFSIAVEVELSDGMDQGEAVNVATCVLNRVLTVNPEEQSVRTKSSADVDPNGLWAVKISGTYAVNFEVQSHWQNSHYSFSIAVTSWSFEAIIDPINRTVECSLRASVR